MKKKITVLILCLTLAIVAAFSGCGKITVTLTTYADPLDFHSQLQKEYLFSNDPENLTSIVDGKTEYSRPEAITLTWADNEVATEYVIEISEDKKFVNDVITLFSNSTEVDVYNLKIATTYYWKVRQNVKGGGKSEVGTFSTVDYGPRNLYIEGVTNARDLGGWKTASGARVQQGLIYRTARLNDSYASGFNKTDRDMYCVVTPEITEKGASVLVNDLKVKTEIDLRALNGNGFPGSHDDASQGYAVVNGVKYVAIPMNNDADINSNREQIKQFFEVLADKNNYPLMYHCNIGTNRTGIVSYLLNGLCGVSQQDLYFDYMFSDFGTIALPTPLNSNRTRTELDELTDGAGAEARVMVYNGATLVEKIENCLIDCGLDMQTINAVRDIMMNGI